MICNRNTIRNSNARRFLAKFESLQARVLPTTLIAVIDVGFDVTTGSAAAYYDTQDGYNSSTDAPVSQGGSLTPVNGANHGDNVSNNVADAINATRSVPGAGNVSVAILPIRDTDSMGNIYDSTIIDGMNYAISKGARVINVSVGSMYSDPNFQNAILNAQAHNIVFVTGAGNKRYGDLSSGVDIDNPSIPYFPADYHSSNVLVAACLDGTGTQLSTQSNWGETHVDLAAPDTTGQGFTSFAAGYTSGVTGTLAALRPDLSAAELVGRIKQTVTHTSALYNTPTITSGEISSRGAVYNFLRAARINSGGTGAGLYGSDVGATGDNRSTSTSHSIDTSTVYSPASQSVFQSVAYGTNFTYSIPNLRPGLLHRPTQRLSGNDSGAIKRLTSRQFGKSLPSHTRNSGICIVEANPIVT